MSIHLSPTERHSQKGPYGRPYANAGWRCSATIADDDELPPRSSQDDGFGYATSIGTPTVRNLGKFPGGGQPRMPSVPYGVFTW